MTIREAVSSVKSLFKFVSSDDLISDRAIANELKSAAIKYIRQQTNRRKLFASPNIFTTLNCIEMVNVPLSECCEYTSPCTISRSKYKIPKIAEGNYGLLVQGVFSINKTNQYKESTANRYANYLRLKLNKKQNFFWIQDDYLYISDPDISALSISAYFEEDFDLELYQCQESDKDCPTNPLDRDFKCPSFLIDDVKKAAYNVILQTYSRVRDDKTDNDLNETV